MEILRTFLFQVHQTPINSPNTSEPKLNLGKKIFYPSAMALQTFYSTKKTLYYNFIETKANEDPQKIQRAAPVELVEIRDVHPPPSMYLNNPWLRKTLNYYEVHSGTIVLMWCDVVEHVIRYWGHRMAHAFTMQQEKIPVKLWDVTDEKSPKKYEGKAVYIWHMMDRICYISCRELFVVRNLKAYDMISMYWDCKDNGFKFKASVDWDSKEFTDLK